MRISRRLAHQVDNRLQVILHLIELHREEPAVAAIRQLSDYLHSHVENREEEQARTRRENP